jgi:hypothetical protein
MESTLQPFLDILREVYVGAEGQHTFVIDNAPGNGILSAIKTLSAKEASTPSHEGGSTVAAHTGHLKWSLDYAMEFFKGNQPQWDWDDSWKRIVVNESEWQELQQELEETYNRLATAIRNVKDWSHPAFVKGVLALLPHAAYHLGAIKQLMLVVKHHEKAAIGLQ